MFQCREKNRTMLNLCINSGHHILPTYEISLEWDNVEFVHYCGGHFENGDARNFSISGIYLGNHNLPTYEMSLNLDNVELVQYCGGHFENGDR